MIRDHPDRAASAPVATILLQRGIVSARVAAGFGFLTLAVGTYVLASAVTPVSDGSTFVPRMIIVGIAFAFLWTPLAVIALRSLPPPEIGYGAAIFNLSAQVGGSLSIAAITTLQDRRQAFWWDELASRTLLSHHELARLIGAKGAHVVVPRLAATIGAQLGGAGRSATCSARGPAAAGDRRHRLRQKPAP